MKYMGGNKNNACVCVSNTHTSQGCDWYSYMVNVCKYLEEEKKNKTDKNANHINVFQLYLSKGATADWLEMGYNWSKHSYEYDPP